MGIAKCKKCNTGFRTSKARETLCASCEVKFQPLPSSPNKTDEEFCQFASDIYGEHPGDALQLNDVFNHRSRLTCLAGKLEDIKDSKERVRQNREIGRLLEEHDELQKNLADMQNRFLKAIMLTTTIVPLGKPMSCAHKPSLSSPIRRHDNNNNMSVFKKDDPDSVTALTSGLESPEPSLKVEDKILLASPVKATAAFFEMAAKRSSVTVDEKSSSKKSSKKLATPAQNVQNSKPLAPVSEATSFSPLRSPNYEEVVEEDRIMVMQTSNLEEESDDEPPAQLARSNSVRNRIKAFEEISRRASTGSWDRKPTPKKTLQF